MRYTVRLLVLNLFLGISAVSGATVVGSSHDLSAGHALPDEEIGTGSHVCVFCHVPHEADVRSRRILWQDPRAEESFAPFSAGSTEVSGGVTGAVAPSSRSRPRSVTNLCLSCHDGSVSSVRVMISVPPHASAGTEVPEALMGVTDEPVDGSEQEVRGVTMRHPVDFPYPGRAAGAEAAYPPAGGPLVAIRGGVYPLDRDGRMQCSTCHDPHGSGEGRLRSSLGDNGQVPNALPSADSMCTDCHRDGERP